MEIKKLSAPLNEDEIKQHWKYKDKIYISCVCITFNQKDYIRDTIDSFLAQETEYRFEIVIHDDVSTDGTRDILLEYKKKYPSIIKLVLQDENQYKKGRKITPLAVSHATGEYIALCEGDDFWISSKKIETQVEHLISNKNIDLCVHNAYAISMKYDKLVNVFKFQVENDQIIQSSEIYKVSGQFSPSASMMIRRTVFDELPLLYYDAPVGDFFLEAIAGMKNVIYLAEKMSVYRLYSEGSWTSCEYSNIDKEINHNVKMLKSLDELSLFVDLKNNSYIKYKKQFSLYNLTYLYFKNKNYKQMIKSWILSLNGNFNIKYHILIVLKIMNLKNR